METPATVIDEIKSGNLERALSEIYKYRDAPTLLDPILRELVGLLCGEYTRIALLKSDASPTTAPAHKVIELIYALRTIRGEKVVLQCLPADFRLLPGILKVLAHKRSSEWKSRYILLLWIAAIVLVPFDMVQIMPNCPAILFDLAINHIGSTGIEREAASTLLARVLSREPDQAEDRLTQLLSDYAEDTTFARMGKLRAIATMLDRAGYVPKSLNAIIPSLKMNSALQPNRTEGEIKLSMKVLCRIALRDWSQVDDAFVVFESFLGHKSGTLRYSAAKYIARLESMSTDEELEGSCLRYSELLSSGDGVATDSNYWSGVLTLIAELLFVVRKPMPEFTSRLCECLKTKGLHYTQERSNHSVGQNVRDAACYVCWALFKSKLDATPIYYDLCDSLVALACLDREINVRRAAAAALQEGLGRYCLMDSKEKLKLIECVNYHELSSLTRCYTEVAPKLSTTSRFVDYVMIHGVQSVYPEMQRLCARSMPLFDGIPYEAKIDRLLADFKSEYASGICMALGYLFTASKSPYRVPEIRNILSNLKPVSELEIEAALRLAPCDVSTVPLLIGLIHSDEPELVISARDAMKFVDSDETAKREVVEICVRKIRENRTFITCLCELNIPSTTFTNLLFTVDPEIRAIAVQRLEAVDTSFLTSCLGDYTVDARGDIGALVRAASIARIVALKLDSPDIQKHLWLICSEPNSHLRSLAGQALYERGALGTKCDPNSGAFYQEILQKCPDEFRGSVTLGIVKSIGSKPSLQTMRASLRAVVAELSDGNSWFLNHVFALDRGSVDKLAPIVRTLQKLALSGSYEPSSRAIAISFNSLIRKNTPEAVMRDAIDILQMGDTMAIVPLQKALRLCKNGLMRQRAAEALFELGITHARLESTDWSTVQNLDAIPNL